MSQILKLRGWVLGVVVLLVAGTGLPAMAQVEAWELPFSTDDIDDNGGTNKSFDSGASFDAGWYRVELAYGAMKYASSFDYSIWGPGGFIIQNWAVEYKSGGGTSKDDLPGGGDVNTRGHASVAAVEQAYGDDATVFYHDASGPIKIYFQEKPDQYENNISYGLTWRLIKIPSVPDDWDGDLDVVVGEIDITNQEQIDQSEVAEVKNSLIGGISTLSKNLTPVWALVPDGLTQGDAIIEFNLPFHAVVYDDDDNIVVQRVDKWDASDGSKRYWIETYGDFPSSSNSITLKLDDLDVTEKAGLARDIDKAYLSIQCPCSEIGSCSGGTNGSLVFTIDLGMTRYGESAGYLRLAADTYSTALLQSASLQAHVHEDLQAFNLGAVGGVIQPKLGTNDTWGVMEVAASTSIDGQYALNFYHDAADLGNPANAYRIVDVINPGTNQLRIVETQINNGSTTRYWEYTYSASGGPTWEMEEGEVNGVGTDVPLRVEKTVQTTVPTTIGGTYTKTTTRREPGASTDLSSVVETWTVYAWGNELTKRVVGTGANALTEQWVFQQTTTDPGYGRCERYYSGTGYWEGYIYTKTSDEVYVSKTVKQLDNNTLPLATAVNQTSVLNANIVVEEYRLPPSNSVVVSSPSTKVTYQKFTTTVANKLASTSYVVRTMPDEAETTGDIEEWSAVGTVADPAGALTDGAYVTNIVEGDAVDAVITKTTRYALQAPGLVDDDSQPGDIKRIDHADGQVTLIERDKDTNLDYVVVTRHGYLNGGETEVAYGTKTTQTMNVRGNDIQTILERASQSDNSGNLFIKSLSKAVATDDFGRPTEIDYFFGEAAADEVADAAGQDTPDYTELITHGCCGTGSERVFTDRAGISSRDFFDALGRMTETTPADGTSGDVPTTLTYDAADRVTQTTVNASDSSGTLVMKTVYDDTGRRIRTEDPEGRRMYFTYRRVSSSGSGAAYSSVDPASDAGAFYWETRVYGHDRSSGTDPTPAIQVVWSDSHGRTIRSWTASTTVTWSDSSPPSGSETLTEESRTTMKYPWVDWASGGSTYTRMQVERWAYHDLPALASDGTVETNYIVAGKTLSDPAGRGFLSTDAAGNITETVYEDGTGRAIKTLIGVDEDGDGDFEASEKHTAARVYFNKFVSGNPTGDDRPWPTRVYAVKPGLTTAPDDSDLDDATPTFTDYVYTQAVEEHDVTSNYLTARRMWSRPEYGPWSYSESDDQGRPVASYTTENGSTTNLLTKSTISYYPDSATPDGDEGKPQYSDTFIVTSGTAGTDKIRSTYHYDDAGRSVKVAAAGSGIQKTAYDVYGRTERAITASEEGANTDADAFTDDIVLTETVPTYDKSGRVTGTVNYERAHDAPGSTTGLLSAAAADQSRSTYSYTWFDDNGRSTHRANLGTDSSYTYLPGTPIEPNTLDTRLVGKTEYDAAGRAYLATDNLGRQTRRFYDDLGRTTYTVENWDGSLTTPASPTSRDSDVNRITQNVFDNSATGGGARIETVAIDPDGDGNTSDNQTTHYIHSGEVLPGERGPIPINARPIAILMPDALEDGTTRANAITEINAGSEVFGDFAFTAYYANGQVQQSTDQRGVQRNLYYTSQGWLDYTNVTEATGNTWDATGDLRTDYTYGDLGETLTKTAYSDAAGTTATSQITYTYDGFYNRLTEAQDHDPTSGGGAGDPKTISWAFDAATSGDIYTKGYRLNTITYPNGRVIQLDYSAPGSINDAISRASAIEDYVDGSSDVEIVSYTYLGSGRLARKDYTTPKVRLDFIDEGSEGTSGADDYEVSWDAFGRPIRQQWETYDGSGDAVDDLVHIAHAYDRNSNRLYDDRKVAPSYSKVFTHDEQDRIASYEQGNIKSDFSGIKANWITGGAEFELNQLGSILGIDPAAETDDQVQTFEYNDANEPTEAKFKGDHQKESFFLDYFDDSSTESNWELPSGSGDGFEIDDSGNSPGVNGVADELAFSIAQDTYDGVQEPEACVILLWKDSTDIGLVAFEGDMYPTGVQPHAAGTEVGFVFGYQNPNDYYIAVAQKSNVGNVYRIHKANPTDTVATKEYIGSCGGFSGNSRFSTKALREAFGGNDIPSGRIGIWANGDGTDIAIEEVQAYNAAQAPNWHGRWRYSEAAQAGKGQRIERSSDYLRIRHRNTLANNAHNDYAAALIDGMTVEKFQITFRAKYANRYARPMLRFAYQGDDNFFQVGLQGDSQSIYAEKVLNDERTSMSPVTDTTAVPSIGDGTKVYFRYESDGSTITGYCIKTDTPPTESAWAAQDPFVTCTTISNNGQGGIGLGTRGEGGIEFEDLTLKSDPDGDGTYDIVEFVDYFDSDSNGFVDLEPEHDAAGNLIYDGLRYYTYDAYNRLIKVQNAFKDEDYTPTGGSAGDLAIGSTIAEYQYDANNRRIRKDTYLGGIHDNVEHFYCIGGSLIETRNGSDQVTQQHVWDNLAGHYIDSLAEVSNNTTQGVDDLCDEKLYALQDQQFNILAITDDTGEVVERYEYTLYGERTIMNATSVVLHKSAYHMNCGFQGLYHDTETGLIYNRARMLNPTLGRFNQRDPYGYPDGMNTYAAYHVMYGGVDPWGLDSISLIHDTTAPYAANILNKGVDAPSGLFWTREKTGAFGGGTDWQDEHDVPVQVEADVEGSIDKQKRYKQALNDAADAAGPRPKNLETPEGKQWIKKRDAIMWEDFTKHIKSCDDGIYRIKKGKGYWYIFKGSAQKRVTVLGANFTNAIAKGRIQAAATHAALNKLKGRLMGLGAAGVFMELMIDPAVAHAPTRSQWDKCRNQKLNSVQVRITKYSVFESYPHGMALGTVNWISSYIPGVKPKGGMSSSKQTELWSTQTTMTPDAGEFLDSKINDYNKTKNHLTEFTTEEYEIFKLEVIWEE